MEPLSQAELAQRAAQDVAVVAGNLQKKWRESWFKSLPGQYLKNLTILATSLQCVSFGQDKYEQGEHGDQNDGSVVKLEIFLHGLERVCTYPRSYLSKSSGQKEPSARFPTLHALVTANSTQTIRSDANINTSHEVEKSVKAFASASSYITRPYFAFLRSFSDAEDQAKKHAKSAQWDAEAQRKREDTKKTKSDEDESYPRHVYDTLYRVVKKHAECCCGLPNPSPKTPRRHWGRLELQANFGTINNEILFHAVFSKNGSSEFDEKIKWQHLQFRVPRRKRKARAVGFEDKLCDDGVECSTRRHDVTDSARPEDAAEVTSVSEFCKLLRKDIGSASMDVRIKDEALLVLKRAVRIEVDIADGRSISLADVLSKYSLVPKTKLVLAYILAKSVWQFYDSDFMSVGWTTRSIQLFRERGDEDDDDEPGVDWAPYYAFSFEQMVERDSVERLPPGQFLHRYPRVLALGAILYELGRKKRQEEQIRFPNPASRPGSVEPPTPEKIINDTTSTVRKGVENKKWPDIKLKNIQALETYRVIVANCVSENIFRPDPKEKLPNPSKQGLQQTAEELEEELTVAERRAILFKKVVAPLKEVVQATGWVDESGNIRRHHVQGGTAHLKEEGPASQKPTPVALLNDTTQIFRTSQTPPDGTQDAQTASGAKAEAWLNEIKGAPVMEAVVSAFQGKELAKRRIRIAVLDTGYDPGAVFFNRGRKRRLVGWRDYVEKDQPHAKDEDGHGTHVLSVLMQVAPAADIFVARVARDTPDLQNATGNIAEAIEWAWKVCQANIVTMSFGFDEEIYIDDKPVVSNAILRALLETDQRILFFAAAANDGGNRGEMFPANNLHVLSIRGTDDYGWAQRFNPPPDYNAKTCFMTLGRNVPGASLTKSEDEGADVCKSGTSVATPIAAGIAAMLLGYARMHENDLQEMVGPRDTAKLSRLWGITGMSALFERMATEMADKWSYLNIHKFTNAPHQMRLSMIAWAVREAVG
ncbi:hypothetical protein QBC46DRAFT_358388 [Diplogelasinospora grovesii]|uniref:Peptidase S8/S53 domain-containing protein n=1 Tax=Diplogelasinospora grovesii TaxID=303347 RepID=A0AAN6RZT2_9PEZI|nr:hypothetical protein QBC46DRAFT_358388 [Diplogelasinospora grovesii]